MDIGPMATMFSQIRVTVEQVHGAEQPCLCGIPCRSLTHGRWIFDPRLLPDNHSVVSAHVHYVAAIGQTLHPCVKTC